MSLLFWHLIDPLLLESALFPSPFLSAVSSKFMPENGVMFSEAQLGVRDASCRTSGFYIDIIEKGWGGSAVTEGQSDE